MKKKQPKVNPKGCAVLIAILVASFFLIRSCTKDSHEEIKAKKEAEIKQKEEEQKTLAYVYSQLCVKQKLKSPSSAKFPYTDEAEILKENDSTYLIKSYVDSQNSFGAMLRTNYLCEVIIVDEEHYICNNTQLY